MKIGERNYRWSFAIHNSEARLRLKRVVRLMVATVVVNTVVTRYSTAIETVLEGTPPMVRIRGTAAPEETPWGTSTFT